MIEITLNQEPGCLGPVPAVSPSRPLSGIGFLIYNTRGWGTSDNPPNTNSRPVSLRTACQDLNLQGLLITEPGRHRKAQPALLGCMHGGGRTSSH